MSSKQHPSYWFNLFKYGIYVLLSFNVVLFFRDEWGAAGHLFANGISLTNIIEAFAATLDTAAWLVLLLIFELETYIISDEKIKGGVKLFLHGTRVFCYCAISYAFYGYWVKMRSLYGFELSPLVDLCSLAANSFSFMTDLDEFELVDATNCFALMNDARILQLPDSTVITDSAALLSAQKLAWTDVINAGDWLFVVLILEVDIRLQLKGKLSGPFLHFNKVVKYVLYSVLCFAAIYWAISGLILDFWDALLWIIAFVFIEMNMFEWQEEASQSKIPTTVSD